MIRTPSLALLGLLVSSACSAQSLQAAQAAQIAQANSASPLTPSSWAQPTARPTFQASSGPIAPSALGGSGQASLQANAPGVSNATNIAATGNAQLASAGGVTPPAPLATGPSIPLPPIPSAKATVAKTEASAAPTIAIKAAPAPKRVFNGTPEDTPIPQLQWGYETLNKQEAAWGAREQAFSARYAELSPSSAPSASQPQTYRASPKLSGERTQWSEIALANGHSQEKINLELSRKSPEQFKAWVQLTAQKR